MTDEGGGHVAGWRDRYEVVGRLGTGSTGTVWLARQIDLGRMVAVKELAPELLGDPVVLQSLRDEARLLATFDHPHLVKVLSYIEGPGEAALVMEHVEGASLRAVLRAAGRLTPEQAVGILEGTLSGLGAAHAAGVVHADIKPENILVDAEGTSKLVDFGMAGRSGARLHVGTGTAAYASPEAVQGGVVEARSDIYCCGAMLFELLSGDPPYRGESAQAILAQHVNAPIPLLDGQPPAIQSLVATAMAKDPNSRFPSAAAFFDALQRAAAEGYGDDWRRRAALLPLITGLGGIGAIALGVGGGAAAAAGSGVAAGGVASSAATGGMGTGTAMGGAGTSAGSAAGAGMGSAAMGGFAAGAGVGAVAVAAKTAAKTSKLLLIGGGAAATVAVVGAAIVVPKVLKDDSKKTDIVATATTQKGGPTTSRQGGAAPTTVPVATTLPPIGDACLPGSWVSSDFSLTGAGGVSASGFKGMTLDIEPGGHTVLNGNGTTIEFSGSGVSGTMTVNGSATYEMKVVSGGITIAGENLSGLNFTISGGGFSQTINAADGGSSAPTFFANGTGFTCSGDTFVVRTSEEGATSSITFSRK